MNRGKKRKIEDLHKELKLIQKILNNNMKTKKKLINKNEKIVSSFLKPKNIWNPIKEKGFVTIGVIPKDGKVLFFENNQVFLDYENLIKNMMKVSEIEHFNWKVK